MCIQHTYIYMYPYMCVYMCIYIYTCIYIYIDTHVCISISISVSLSQSLFLYFSLYLPSCGATVLRRTGPGAAVDAVDPVGRTALRIAASCVFLEISLHSLER